MARHVCPECGATVTGDEQFCPTCGAFLGEEEAGAHDDYEHFELGSTPPPPPPSRPTVSICPSCGVENAPGNRHCEECGARLSQGPLPAAPRPAVQATAGVRAVIAIGALLLAIIIIALLFQLFSGEDPATTTTTVSPDSTTTTVQTAVPEVLDPLDIECSVEALGSFICENMISENNNEFQVNWPELEESGGDLTITIRFRTPVAVTRIDWSNIGDDDTRFRRNYRARSLTISADDAIVDIQHELENVPGTQQLNFSSVETTQIQITIDSVWDPEIVEEQIFTELAIDEIEVIGYPSRSTGTTGTTGTTDTTDTTGTPDTTDTTETTETTNTTEAG